MTPPTAADIVANPARVADVDPATLPAILAQLSTVTAAVAARLGTLPREAPATTGDRLLRVEEASTLLAMSDDWCLRSPAAKHLRVRNGTDVRFSYLQIQRHIARQRDR